MNRVVSILLLAFVLAAVVLAGASADVTYLDPAGDAGGQLDVTNVSVVVDRATGTVTLAIAVTGFAAADYDGRPRDIQVYIRADSAGSTRTGAGPGHLALMAELTSGGLSGYVGHPVIGTWPFEPLPSTMGLARTANGLVWTFNKSEAGIDDRFDFLMYTQMPDSVGGTWSIRDHAPDGVGVMWSYYPELEPAASAPPSPPPVVKPIFGDVTTTPVHPTAGRRVAFAVAVRRSDTGGPFLTGRLTLEPRIAGRLLKHTEWFRQGVVHATFLVPRTSRGQILGVRVRVATSSTAGAKVFEYRIR